MKCKIRSMHTEFEHPTAREVPPPPDGYQHYDEWYADLTAEEIVEMAVKYTSPLADCFTNKHTTWGIVIRKYEYAEWNDDDELGDEGLDFVITIYDDYIE